MELSASVSEDIGRKSIFVYAGLPGDLRSPAAFMHREAIRIRRSSISHHWLD
jgi:hypothetical protein